MGDFLQKDVAAAKRRFRCEFMKAYMEKAIEEEISEGVKEGGITVRFFRSFIFMSLQTSHGHIICFKSFILIHKILVSISLNRPFYFRRSSATLT